jgi:hypothetical protein
MEPPKAFSSWPSPWLALAARMAAIKQGRSFHSTDQIMISAMLAPVSV